MSSLPRPVISFTASLDPRSEYEVFQRFTKNTAGKIAILITHRLGSVKMADRLLVFKQGELVEEGSHEALMSLGGEYAQLFSIQAENYQRDDMVAQGST